MKNAIIKAKGKKKYLVSAEPPAAGMEAAARINHWHEVAKQSSEMAIAAALNAGLELFKAKVDHPGTFEKWLEANCNFSRRTAYKYLSLVQQAISADELPKIANGSDKMRQAAIEEYAAETDSKSLTELYCDLGIIKKTPTNMGGKREGAGRKRKDDAEEMGEDLDAAVNTPGLLAAAIKGPIEALWQLYKERDVFNRIDDETLGQAAGLLDELCRAATITLKLRVK
ncbi:MAG: DUF3102 domain-containing protein [Kiritimatiellae bacterium]|nr:DUF3102 domain-containing protein [Kiritimatiellia bacterium]